MSHTTTPADQREVIEQLRQTLTDYNDLREQLESLVSSFPGYTYGAPLNHLANTDLVNILRDHLSTPAHA